MFGIVYWKIMIISCVAAITLWPAATPQAQPVAFAEWLKELKTEARARGIRPVILDSALAGVRPIKRVIELDRRQPEFTLVFWDYLSNSVNDQRVSRGRKLLAEHRPLLKRVARKYGVQPRFLVAFWGLESNFGKYTGTFPVVGALVTLAHDRRHKKRMVVKRGVNTPR